MESKVLGIAGKSGAGKSSLSHFVNAAIISAITVGDDEQNLEYIAKVSLNEEGEILVETDNHVLSDGSSANTGILNLQNRDPSFLSWMSDYVYPFVREIPLSSRLREFCVDMYGLDWYILNGSRADKETLTPYTYMDLPGKAPKGVDPKTVLTYRAFLMHFGEFFRQNSKLLWENRWWEQVEASGSEVVTTPDIRHDESCIFLKDRGARLIHLLGEPYPSNHSSENSIKTFKDFDLVVDTGVLSMEETHKLVFEKLVEWGFLEV